MVSKIFPSAVGNSPFSSFKIFFLSEGFTASQQPQFSGACVEFVDRLLASPPFNLTRMNPHWLSIYRLFVPSANSGPALGVLPAAGRTAFESSIDVISGNLSINPVKVGAVLDAENIRSGSDPIPLSEMVSKNLPTWGPTGAMVVLLIPETAGRGAELEYRPAAEEYYFIATTLNGEWHQVILRSLGLHLGLGDEFDLDGQDFQAPRTQLEKAIYHRNLVYLENPPLTNGAISKWKELFSRGQQKLQTVVHPKSALRSAIDRSLPEFPFSPDTVEIWEGGGGYQERVYRTAMDCLMRRRIGDTTLPIRENALAFCVACRKVLANFVL